MNNNDNYNNSTYQFSNQNENGYNPQIQQQTTNTSINYQFTQQVNDNDYGSDNNSKNNNAKKIIIIVVSIFLAGVIIFFATKLLFKDKINETVFGEENSPAFFLKNKDSKYALFSDEGKQLTEFIYTDVGSFKNGTADVQIDDEYGIINTSGKMTVPLGKYEYIFPENGLYKVSQDKNDTYIHNLINGHGKVLYNLDEVELKSYIAAPILIIELKKDKKYKVLNAKGKEVLSFAMVNDKEPIVSEDNGFVSVFYNGKNWIFNKNAEKEIVAFDSEFAYCINGYPTDESLITLNTCGSGAPEKMAYKIVKNGKVYDKSNECSRVFKIQDTLICEKDNYKEYLLDSNLNITIERSKASYIDSDNYAVNNGTTSKGVDFYQNGKLVKNVPCKLLKTTSNKLNIDIYLLKNDRSCDGKLNSYEYYKSNGEKLIDKSFYNANEFDLNGLAKVGDQASIFYLIDKTGNKVSGDYSNIYTHDGYYTMKNKELLWGILDKNGKEILPPKYLSIGIKDNNGKTYGLIETTDSKYIVYDLENNKELLNLDSKPNLDNSHYIKVSSNGKTQYYTYDGKLFYEE